MGCTLTDAPVNQAKLKDEQSREYRLPSGTVNSEPPANDQESAAPAAARGGGFDDGVLPVKHLRPCARHGQPGLSGPAQYGPAAPAAGPPRPPLGADEPGSDRQPVLAGRTSRDPRSQSRWQDAAGSVQRIERGLHWLTHIAHH